MARIIDSSVLVALERRGLPLETLTTLASPDEDAALAAVTVSELMLGIHRSDTAARRLRRENFLDALLDTIPVLPFDLRVARTYGRVWSELMGQGQMIGIHDAQIAATALAHGYAVLTDNVRDFERIPGLTVTTPNWP